MRIIFSSESTEKWRVLDEIDKIKIFLVYSIQIG